MKLLYCIRSIHYKFIVCSCVRLLPCITVIFAFIIFFFIFLYFYYYYCLFFHFIWSNWVKTFNHVIVLFIVELSCDTWNAFCLTHQRDIFKNANKFICLSVYQCIAYMFIMQCNELRQLENNVIALYSILLLSFWIFSMLQHRQLTE